MANTTLDRNTQKRGPIRQVVLDLDTNQTIPIGVMVMTVAGKARNADDSTAGALAVGISCQAASFAAGDRKIVVEKGIFKMDNDGTITVADVMGVATVLDNHTVSKAATTTNDIGAGIIDRVESDGVFVDMTGARVSAT